MAAGPLAVPRVAAREHGARASCQTEQPVSDPDRNRKLGRIQGEAEQQGRGDADRQADEGPWLSLPPRDQQEGGEPEQRAKRGLLRDGGYEP